MTAIAAIILKCHGLSLNIMSPIIDPNITDVSLKDDTIPKGVYTLTEIIIS